jgi:hypothetical protein
MFQLNEQEVSKELAKRWGPGVVSRLERLQLQLKEVQKPQSDSESVTQPATGWYDSVKKQAQTYPSLLAVKSTPLVNRMLSTLQSQMEPPAATTTPAQCVTCQCNKITPHYQCKQTNITQSVTNEIDK